MSYHRKIWGAKRQSTLTPQFFDELYARFNAQPKRPASEDAAQGAK
jgi:hypothetical protein